MSFRKKSMINQFGGVGGEGGVKLIFVFCIVDFFSPLKKFVVNSF